MSFIDIANQSATPEPADVGRIKLYSNDGILASINESGVVTIYDTGFSSLADGTVPRVVAGLGVASGATSDGTNFTFGGAIQLGNTLTQTAENAGDTLQHLFQNSSSVDRFDIGYNDTTGNAFIAGTGAPININTDGVNDVAINPGSGFLGVNITSPVSTLHIFENTTGAGEITGLTIEQMGTSDALLHFTLTGAQDWTVGVDNSMDDTFAIQSNDLINANAAFRIATDDTITVAGDIVPATDAAQALGAVGLRWTDIFLDSTIHYTGPLEFESPNGVLLTFNTSAAESDINIISPSVTGFGQINFVDSLAVEQASLTYDEANDELDLVSQGIIGLQAANGGSTGILSSGGADTNHVLAIVNSGTNGGATDIFMTDRTPIGNITGAPGNIAIRTDGVNSAMFQHVGASSSNTDWEEMNRSGNVTTSDTLTASSILVGNGGVDIEARDTVTIDSAGQTLDIEAIGNGTASLTISDGAGVPAITLNHLDLPGTNFLTTVGNFTVGVTGILAASSSDAMSWTADTNDMTITSASADIVLAAGDDVRVTNSGTATVRIEGSNATAIHNVADGYVQRLARSSAGGAVWDFEGRPSDGTSSSNFRFGISSGSTGTNNILLAEADSVNINTAFSSSGADSYINAFGGNLGIGETNPAADLHITNGTASIRLEGSGAELRLSSATQTDIANMVTAGVANFDFTNLPLDGTSSANFRFGALSGSTGINAFQFKEANSSTNNHILRSSGGDSSFCTVGGMLGVGATGPSTLFHLTNIGADTVPIQEWETTGTNAGTMRRFVGDQDPNGAITGAGGDEYHRASGTTSASYINQASATDTVWRQDSLISEGALEIWSLDDLPAPSGGVITLPSGLYKFMAPINFGTTRLDTTGNSVQMYAENSFVNSLTYEGTGTFITATDTSGVRVFYPGITFILSGDGATFCDIVGSIGIQFSSILFTHVNGGHLGILAGKDTGALTSSRFIMTRTVVRQWLTGFNISDTSRSYCNTLNIFSHVNASSGFINIVDADALMFVVNVEVQIDNVNASFINIDPTNPNPFYLNNNFLTGVGPFFQTGVTGTFTAVVANAMTSTAITGVTDDGGGNAVFTTGGLVPFVGQTIVISGYITNTDYNGTFVCTSTAAGLFEAAVKLGATQIQFGTDEATGSVAGDGITVTSTAHGLANEDTLTLDCDLSTEYGGGYRIYNVQTNTFDVNAVFGATQTGEWDTSGKTGASPGVRTFTNTGAEDSHFIATAFVNSNVTGNGTIVNNTFTDMVFGTVGSALIEGSTAERWKLVDEINGTFEYQGDARFDGSITFDLTTQSSGGTVPFRFKIVHDVGAGFVDLSDNVIAEAQVGSNSKSLSKTFPLRALKGDQFKPQITRDSGTSGITTTFATFYTTA